MIEYQLQKVCGVCVCVCVCFTYVCHSSVKSHSIYEPLGLGEVFRICGGRKNHVVAKMMDTTQFNIEDASKA